MGLDHDFDIVFIGWMEPGTDFRDEISKRAQVIVTTLDQGSKFETRVKATASNSLHGESPSWEDVNIEIMNRHYTRISMK